MWRSSQTKRYMLDTAFIGALSVGLYAVFPPFSDIYRVWRREAGLGIYSGLRPGEFEYPPLAALYFEPLAGLPSSRWAVIVNGIVMVVAALGVTRLLLKAVTLPNGERVDLRMWAMSPALLFFLPINWDVAAVWMALAAVVALQSQRHMASGSLLAAGTSLKVFPGALVLPLVPLIQGWSHRLRFLGSASLVLAVSYVAYIIARPDTWRIHLDFAASRDDFESTLWGVLDWVGGAFGVSLSLDLVNWLSTLAVLAALVMLTHWVWIRRPAFAQAAALALIALLLFNKVFKPQYVLWVLPFLAWNGSDRSTVRLVEFTAIAHIAVTYFPLPSVIVQIAAAIRIVALSVIGAAIVRQTTRNVMAGGASRAKPDSRRSSDE